mmetsp:Transcript_2002/g.4083  ORF Transcript_2002/g.4083 Transcript_2002/m.4083 type:complete len:164 (+) Transcript_2002:3-494(+)
MASMLRSRVAALAATGSRAAASHITARCAQMCLPAAVAGGRRQMSGLAGVSPSGGGGGLVPGWGLEGGEAAALVAAASRMQVSSGKQDVGGQLNAPALSGLKEPLGAMGLGAGIEQLLVPGLLEKHVAEVVEAGGRNSRRPKKPNKGKRPNCHVGRRMRRVRS